MSLLVRFVLLGCAVAVCESQVQAAGHRFGDAVDVVINATTARLTGSRVTAMGGDALGILNVIEQVGKGPLVSLQANASSPSGSGPRNWNGTFLQFTLADLLVPFGPNTYVDNVAITYSFRALDAQPDATATAATTSSGPSPTHAYLQLGLRRSNASTPCCPNLGTFCKGLYTSPEAVVLPNNTSTLSHHGARSTLLPPADAKVTTLSWRVMEFAERTEALPDKRPTVQSPDGHTVLDMVVGLQGGSPEHPDYTFQGIAIDIWSISYSTMPLTLASGCNLVVPWEDHSTGHGSLGGHWLMFYRGNTMTIQGQGYLSERWEDECCFDGEPGLPRSEPTYAVNQTTTSFQYLGGGGGWIEGNYPPIGYINKFYRLSGVNGGPGTVTIMNRERGAQYNQAVSPVTFDAMVPSATDPSKGIYSLNPMAVWDDKNQQVYTQTRAGRPWRCGSSPSWDCSSCMDGHEDSSPQTCNDPTYPADAEPTVAPTPMCQFPSGVP
eukprot:m.478512 g.478512  ORF g.478512 m.478512 type:complete len:494 (-) comp21155_c0_seq1:137-1618(-)